MTKRSARRPSIPTYDDPRGFADAVREALEVGMGQTGNVLDRWATLRDLKDAGLSGVSLAGRGSLTGPSGGAGGFDSDRPTGSDPDPYGENDPTVPPRPTGVEAVGLSLDAIGVRWDPPPYNNHAYAEVFASLEDNVAAIRASFDFRKPTDANNTSPFLVGKTSSNLFIHQGQGDTVPIPVTRFETDSAQIVVRNHDGQDERQLEVRLSRSDNLTATTFKIGDVVALRSDDGNDLDGTIFEVTQFKLGTSDVIRELYLRQLPARYTDPLPDGSHLAYTYTPGVWVEKVYGRDLDRPVTDRYSIVSSNVELSGGSWYLKLLMDVATPGQEMPSSAINFGDRLMVLDLTRLHLFNGYAFNVQSYTLSGGQYVSTITLGPIPQDVSDKLTSGQITYQHVAGIFIEIEDQQATSAQTSTELEEALNPSAIYYWVRFVSAASVVGEFQSEAGVPGRVMLDPERILNALTQRITSTQLSQDLLNPIAFISGPVSERNPDGSRRFNTVREFVESLGDARIGEYDAALDEVYLGFLGGDGGDVALAAVGYGRESIGTSRIFLRVVVPSFVDAASEPGWVRDLIDARDGEDPQQTSTWHITTQDEQLFQLRWDPLTGSPNHRHFYAESVSDVTVGADGKGYALLTLRPTDASTGLPSIYYDTGQKDQSGAPIFALHNSDNLYSIQGRTSFRVVGQASSDWRGIATAAAYVNRLRGRTDELGAFMEGLETWQAAFQETTATGIFEIMATIQRRALVSADDQGALAYLADNVQVEMDLNGDGFPESIGLNQMASTVVADNRGRIRNSWTVRMNQFANGQVYAAGFGLSLEPGLDKDPVSSFIVSADQFAIQGTLDRFNRLEEWLRVTDGSVQGKEVWLAVRGRPHLSIWAQESLYTQRKRLIVSLPPVWRTWAPLGYDETLVESRLDQLRQHEYVLYQSFQSGNYPARDPITGAETGGFDERWILRLRLPAGLDHSIVLPQPPQGTVFQGGTPQTINDLTFAFSNPAESAIVTSAVNVPFVVDTESGVVGIRGSLVVDGMISTQELEVSRLLRANRIWAQYMHVGGLEASAIVTGKIATRRTSGWALRIQQPTAANGRKVIQVGRFPVSSTEVEVPGNFYTDDPGLDPLEFLDGKDTLAEVYPQLRDAEPAEETFYITDQGKAFFRGSIEVAGGALFHLDIEEAGNFDYMVRMDHVVPFSVAQRRFYTGSDGVLVEPSFSGWFSSYNNEGDPDFYPTNLDRLERNALFWTNIYGEAGFNTTNNAIYVDDDPLALASGTGGVGGVGVGICKFRPVRRLFGSLARVSCVGTVSYSLVNPTLNRRFRGVSYALWLVPTSTPMPTNAVTLFGAVNFRVFRYVGINTTAKRDLSYEAYINAMNAVPGAYRVCEVFDGSAAQYATLAGVIDVPANQEYRLYMTMVERYGIDSDPGDFAHSEQVYSETLWVQQISASEAAGSPKTGSGTPAGPIAPYAYEV